ncbi:MAG: hypothetical protein M1268_02095 [Patescibacteria group bacterium]|nr:hypothetical protein [Patescibacteria group bacterium]
MNAYKIKVNGKILDYRLGNNLNLDDVKSYFEKEYKVEKLWQETRHVVGYLKKVDRELFLKLSTTEGISAVTKIEESWNEEFNKRVSRTQKFWVPKNFGSGYYKDNLFYLITDLFNGNKLCERVDDKTITDELKTSIEDIIEFSEIIQNLNLNILNYDKNLNYKDRFINKTNSWFNAIPKDVKEKYLLSKLLDAVKNGANNLSAKARHGDFTPWHMIRLKTGQLGLIDGEHALSKSVEYYDIAYFIQRVFSVLKNPEFAQKSINLLIKKNYDLNKLKVLLAARAVGGFLDESLTSSPDYTFSERFKNWVIHL